MGSSEFIALLTVLLVAAVTVWRASTADSIAPARRPAESGEPGADREDDPDVPRAAIIVNPTKFDDIDALRDSITHVCRRHGWAEPLWLETTEDDPGTGQAKRALREQVDLVCPLGGDGTVRAVAAAVVDSGVPLGLLPGGTGNLMARNLELPVDSIEDALVVALTGRTRTVDVGLITVVEPEGTQETARDYVFLVMAGIGFDADVMAGMDEDLKAKVGWVAYVVAGAKNLNGRRFAVQMSFDGRPAEQRRVRTAMLGNCGKVQLGVSLIPDAEVDDGSLDAVIVSPKGVLGWAGVVGAFLTHNHRGHRRIEHRRFERAELVLEAPQELQLDGDPIGPAQALTIAVHPRSLLVKVGYAAPVASS